MAISGYGVQTPNTGAEAKAALGVAEDRTVNVVEEGIVIMIVLLLHLHLMYDLLAPRVCLNTSKRRNDTIENRRPASRITKVQSEHKCS
jgi:hypothetical protein